MKGSHLVSLALLGFAYISLTRALATTGDNCISTCKGQKGGLYQSCESCKDYYQCKKGKLVDTLRCGKGLKWNDNSKKCTRKSSCKLVEIEETTTPPTTTTIPTTTTTTTPTTTSQPLTTMLTTGDNCIRSCKKMDPGLYQSCDSCREYIQCQKKKPPKTIACDEGLKWNDDKQKCTKRSPCRVTVVTEPTASVTTTPSLTTATSLTTGEDVVTTAVQPTTTTTSVIYTTGPDCIRSCKGEKKGLYQSCDTCKFYYKCGARGKEEILECTGRTKWNDAKKQCTKASSCKKVEVQTTTTTTPIVTTEATTTAEVTTEIEPTTEPTTTLAPTMEPTTEPTTQTEYITTEEPVTTTTTRGPPTTAITTGDNCVDSCSGLSPGYYQLCDTCKSYLQCRQTKRPRHLSCGPRAMWDDASKSCKRFSTTCDVQVLTEPPTTTPTTTTTPATTTPSVCEQNCNGKDCLVDGDDIVCQCTACDCAKYYTSPDCDPSWGACRSRSGNYPNFDDCTKYVECFRGQFVADHDCEAGKAFHPWTLECEDIATVQSVCVV